jgi:hypothetical protein
MVFAGNVDSPWARSSVRSLHQYAAIMIDRTGNSKSETFVAQERKRRLGATGTIFALALTEGVHVPAGY